MKNDPIYTGPFRELIPQYILFKRGQGYDYNYYMPMRLREIDLFLQKNGVTEPVITEEMHEMWCAKRDGENPVNQSVRISVICCFEKWLVEQMNMPGIFVEKTRRKYRHSVFIPYIFSEEEIIRSFRIMDESMISCEQDMRTLSSMFALFYGCGLRRSEAQNLRLCDVDLNSGKIRILDSKNHESRIVFASASIKRRLDGYKRTFLKRKDETMPFFQKADGNAFGNYKLYALFYKVMELAEIKRPDNGRRPRIHDLRHTYAVRALEAMERKGYDLYVALPLLSRSMGHKQITDTEYYLRLREEHFSSILDKTKAHSPTLPVLPPKPGGVE